MNNSILRWLWMLPLVLFISACGSSPRSNYYILTAGSGSGTPPAGETPSLGIGPMQIPEYLNRSNLVYHRQGNSLEISNTENWAEPLDEGITRVIAINLAQLLNTQDVRFFPWHPKRAPDYGVKVNLLSLDASDRQATLAAEWLVYRTANAQTVRRRVSRLHHPLPEGDTGPGQIAPAYSQLLWLLSKLIAEAVSDDMEAPADR